MSDLCDPQAGEDYLNITNTGLLIHRRSNSKALHLTQTKTSGLRMFKCLKLLIKHLWFSVVILDMDITKKFKTDLVGND